MALFALALVRESVAALTPNRLSSRCCTKNSITLCRRSGIESALEISYLASCQPDINQLEQVIASLLDLLEFGRSLCTLEYISTIKRCDRRSITMQRTK
jgi:hypothetical protein